MASVAPETVLLSLGADLTQILELETTALSDDDEVPGEVVEMANGVLRAVIRPGRRWTAELTVELDDRVQLQTLRSWAGQRVLLRDPFGRKRWCLFFSSPATERVPVGLPEVSFTLQEITFDETA